MEETIDKIWERQENETDKSYAAFEIYLQMGPDRNLRAIDTKLVQTGYKGASLTSLGSWSSKYNWVSRASAFDDYMSKKKSEVFENEILEAVRRHARGAKILQELGLKAMESEAFKKDFEKGDVTIKSAIDAYKIGIDIERLALGIPNDISQVHAEIKRTDLDELDKIKNMTDEELLEEISKRKRLDGK